MFRTATARTERNPVDQIRAVCRSYRRDADGIDPKLNPRIVIKRDFEAVGHPHDVRACKPASSELNGCVGENANRRTTG